MSRYKGNGQRCPVCGLTYKRLNTGLSYQDVFERLKDYSEDTADWTYKRRSTVLGKMHEYKQLAWKKHLADCEEQIRHPSTGDAFEPALAVVAHVEGVPF